MDLSLKLVTRGRRPYPLVKIFNKKINKTIRIKILFKGLITYLLYVRSLWIRDANNVLVVFSATRFDKLY